MKRSEMHKQLARDMKPLYDSLTNILHKKVLQDTIEFHKRKAIELSARGK